jgi:NtrC-family two-component system sensor histidine kinase KinB
MAALPTLKRHRALERRMPLLFGLLAVCVLGLLGLGGSAYRELLDAQREQALSRAVLAEIDAIERAIAARPALLLCAVQGIALTGPPLPADAAGPLARLRELLTEPGPQQRQFEALPGQIDALQREHSAPLSEACSAGRRLGTARALEIEALGAQRRGELQATIERLRDAERGLLAERQARLDARTDEASQRFVLLALATAVLTLVATVGLRGVATRLTETSRRLRHEAHERSLAQELQHGSQRRLAMLLEHIPEAVVAFDAEARVLWTNPAGEAMFGHAHAALRRTPLARLLPELEQWLHWPDTQPELDPGEKLPASWTVRREAMLGLHADGREFPIELTLVQTRVGGERVGLCICRELQAPGPADPRAGPDGAVG